MSFSTLFLKTHYVFVAAGVLHGGGVQGVVGPDGGETEGNETGGQHLQEDRKSHSERTYRDLVPVIE